MSKFVKVLTVLILFLIFLSAVYKWVYIPFNSEPSVVSQEYKLITLDSDKVFNLINDWRVSSGFKPYIKDERLCQIASDRSNDERLDKHEGFIEKYWEYPYSLSENLTRAKSEKTILSSWLSSPPHRATLEKDYTYSCVACKGDYCVHIFSNF